MPIRVHLWLISRMSFVFGVKFGPWIETDEHGWCQSTLANSRREMLPESEAVSLRKRDPINEHVVSAQLRHQLAEPDNGNDHRAGTEI